MTTRCATETKPHGGSSHVGAARRLLDHLRKRVGLRSTPGIEEAVACVARIAADVVSTSPDLPDGAKRLVVHGMEDLRSGRKLGFHFSPTHTADFPALGCDRDRALLESACGDWRLHGTWWRVRRSRHAETEVPIERPASAILRAVGDKRPALTRLRVWLASDPTRPDGTALLAMVDAEIAMDARRREMGRPATGTAP